MSRTEVNFSSCGDLGVSGGVGGVSATGDFGSGTGEVGKSDGGSITDAIGGGSGVVVGGCTVGAEVAEAGVSATDAG